MIRKIVSIALLLVFTACANNSLSGEYHAQGFSVISTLKFLGGGKVELSNMAKTSMGTYELDGSKLIVSANGDTIVFTISNDGNCIDGGGMLGTYCKK